MKECAKTKTSSRGGTTKRSPSLETRHLRSMGLLHPHAHEAIPSGFAMTDEKNLKFNMNRTVCFQL